MEYRILFRCWVAEALQQKDDPRNIEKKQAGLYPVRSIRVRRLFDQLHSSCLLIRPGFHAVNVGA